MRRIVLLGPPGSGKGTQGERLAQALGVPRIAAGDLLRDEIKRGTPLGMQAKSYMDRGDLVPLELVVRMIRARLTEVGQNGFVLDGFPRNLAQAEALEQSVQVDRIIHIALSREEVVRRLGSRWVCEQCGRNYNLLSQRPGRAGLCDACGGKLVQRSDDRPDVVAKRYDTQYNSEIAGLLRFYEERGLLETVAGEGSVDEVYQRLWQVLP
jgi:adenylate kinase